MNIGRRERVKELLSQAAQFAPSRRRAFVEQAAADDGQVAAEALELLRTLDDSGFMSAPTAAAPAAITGLAECPTFDATAARAAAEVLEGPGTRIGRYKLLQKIGEGGFGTVFMAEQTEPVTRRVALKIIKAGMDTRQVIARFETERQALALMDHPNIARVLDGGATDTGRPYFVMELVKGEPITKFCDRERLSVEQRLQLFADVCRAVQHAHQKGVIHRDLKPSNVLVTVADSQPLPKVIDFGIAKATAAPLTDKTLFTEMHQLIGTPEYMSPEQAEPAAADVDTRSDVYSLGVLLYELLTGTTPFDGVRLKSAGLQGLVRIIREEEPPRPSVRMQTLVISPSRLSLPAPCVETAGSSAFEIARCRRADPQRLQRRLRGDLDWIIMKCLEKDRRRRYETANALAADLQRCLSGEPVLAAPPSRLYLARKMLRRYRAAVSVILVFVGALIVSLVGVGVGLVRAQQAQKAEAIQRKTAEDNARDAALQAAHATRLSNFLESMWAALDPKRGIGSEVSLRTILDDASKSLDTGRLRDEPETEAAWRMKLGGAYYAWLNDFHSAEREYADAAATLARVLGPSHRLTLGADDRVGIAVQYQGRYAEAAEIARRTLERRSAAFGAEDPDTIASMDMLSRALLKLKRVEEAESLLVRAVEIRRRVQGDDHPNTIDTISNLGDLYLAQSRLAEAEVQYREMLERAARVYGNQSTMFAFLSRDLARCLGVSGKTDASVELCQEILRIEREAHGDRHRMIAETLSILGYVYMNADRLEDAERILAKALEIRREVSPGELGVSHALIEMSKLRVKQNRLAEAEELMREALEIRRKLAAAHSKSGDPWSLRELASVLGAQGRQQEADELVREAEEIESRTGAVE